MPTATLNRELVYHRPYLYPKQEAAIFAPTRYAEIEAGTKTGKTHGCLAWLFEQAVQAQPGQHVWWVAPWYGAADIAFRRSKRAIPKDLAISNESKLTHLLANDVTMWFKSGEKSDALYGEDVVAAVLDEASRMREESWHAVRSTLTATKGKCRFIGNVKGRKNWFWQLCRKAETGNPDHTWTRLTWRDAVEAGVLDASEIEDARRTLPEHVFKELYEAEASNDEGNPFGLVHLQACVGMLSVAPPVVWGWDLAKSVDWTWGIALDAQGIVCRSVRFQAPWEDTIIRIRQETGNTPALVDSTGVGDPILETLQRGPGRFRGFKFSASSKQQLMEGLALTIQQHAVTGIPSDLMAELEAFEYCYTRTGVQYSAPDGMHDDGVCALALAVSMYQQTMGRELRLLNPNLAETEEAKTLAQQQFNESVIANGYYWP